MDATEIALIWIGIAGLGLSIIIIILAISIPRHQRKAKIRHNFSSATYAVEKKCKKALIHLYKEKIVSSFEAHRLSYDRFVKFIPFYRAAIGETKSLSDGYPMEFPFDRGFTKVINATSDSWSRFRCLFDDITENDFNNRREEIAQSIQKAQAILAEFYPLILHEVRITLPRHLRDKEKPIPNSLPFNKIVFYPLWVYRLKSYFYRSSAPKHIQ